ncbi:MAG: glycine--tRNA ligase subunit beta [Nitrospirae bacterium]|jgi:glycyl-tRNA synthetase beta chain|nr:glycine--tRNA ligase subunit beta [Nitrospirota bacterium]
MKPETPSLFPKPSHALDRAALLEVGCEELPAGVLPVLREAMESRSRALRRELRLGNGAVRVFGTPARLILLLEELPEEQAPLRETVFGPPARLAGRLPDAPSPQTLGFAKNQGVGIHEIRIETTPKGEYLAVDKISEVRKTRDVLTELFQQSLEDLPLPKTMRWGSGTGPFLRPVLWVMAFLGDQPLEVRIAGVNSDTTTRAPRFAGFRPCPVRGISHYAGLLEEWGIEADPEKRGERIERDLDLALRMEQDVGGIPPGVVRRPDPGLTTEVKDLVEAYRVIGGCFPERYLDLPSELIQTVLRVHQRFYVLENPDGSLSNRFLAVSGNPDADIRLVQAGFEKVVRARLEDAQYYLGRDRSRPLASYVSDLEGMVFFPGVGSLSDKIRMSRELCVWVLDHVPEDEVNASGLSRGEMAESLDRLCSLAKADLATGLVREFPELEGIIGASYWLAEHRELLEKNGKDSGRIRLESAAIREHYRPRHAQDAIAGTLPGRILSLADKILHQVGGLAGGFLPTGSMDPYALRRAANGMMAILRETRWPVSLVALIRKSRTLIPGKDPSAELERFWKERVTAFWEREYPATLVRTAIAGLSEPVWLAGSRMAFLKEALDRPEAASLVALYTRLSNILSGEGDRTTMFPDPALFRHDAERELFLLAEKEGLLRETGWSEMARKGDWEGIWASSAVFVEPVQALFEAVMVNDPDPSLRENRRRLLGILADGMSLLGRLDQAPSSLRGG